MKFKAYILLICITLCGCNKDYVFTDFYGMSEDQIQKIAEAKKGNVIFENIIDLDFDISNDWIDNWQKIATANLEKEGIKLFYFEGNTVAIENVPSLAPNRKIDVGSIGIRKPDIQTISDAVNFYFDIYCENSKKFNYKNYSKVYKSYDKNNNVVRKMEKKTLFGKKYAVEYVTLIKKENWVLYDIFSELDIDEYLKFDEDD